ncbi:hypothetical protein DFS34DRAFT_589996 [Phlyctochytrium arcticum]|nr:hypothetical protein DFS34DRAFT_589996 [Phlyctochytrium arcticum]
MDAILDTTVLKKMLGMLCDMSPEHHMECLELLTRDKWDNAYIQHFTDFVDFLAECDKKQIKCSVVAEYLGLIDDNSAIEIILAMLDDMSHEDHMIYLEKLEELEEHKPEKGDNVLLGYITDYINYLAECDRKKLPRGSLFSELMRRDTLIN